MLCSMLYMGPGNCCAFHLALSNRYHSLPLFVRAQSCSGYGCQTPVVGYASGAQYGGC